MSDSPSHSFFVVDDEEGGEGLLFVHDDIAYKKYYSRHNTIFVKCAYCSPDVPACCGRGKIRNETFRVTHAHCCHPKTGHYRTLNSSNRERLTNQTPSTNDDDEESAIHLNFEQLALFNKLSPYPSLGVSINETIDNLENVYNEKCVLDDVLNTKRAIKRLANYSDFEYFVHELVDELEDINDETFFRDINFDKKIFVNKHFVLSKDAKRDGGGLNQPPPLRFMIFTSSKLDEVIKGYTGSLFIERTFKSLPYLFDNLLTFYVEYKKHLVPIIYALMNQRTETLYTDVFQYIQILTRNASFAPSVILSDWDMACLRALSIAYPRAKIRGCWYHYATILYKKLKRVGLQREFSRNMHLRGHIRSLMSLPFLPKSIIHRAFIKLWDRIGELSLCDQRHSRLNKYYGYFYRHWMRKIGTEYLSVYGFHHRTNQSNRRFRDALARRVPESSSLKTSRFFSRLSRAIDEMDEDIAIIGEGGTRPTWTEKIEKKNRLVRWEALFGRGNLDPFLFLLSIRCCYQKVINEFLEMQDFSDNEVSSDEEIENGGGGGGGELTKEEEENKRICHICFVNRKNAAIIPCGHTLCTACYFRIAHGNNSAARHCPECRGPVDEFVQLFGF